MGGGVSSEKNPRPKRGVFLATIASNQFFQGRLRLQIRVRVEILVTPRGNKNQFGISWKGHFAGVEFDTGVVDEKLISGATKHYDAWPIFW